MSLPLQRHAVLCTAERKGDVNAVALQDPHNAAADATSLLASYSFKEGARISPTWVLKHGETGDFNAVIGGSLPLQYWPASAGAGLSSREIRGRGWGCY